MFVFNLFTFQQAEATPVPQISWYMEIAETTTSLPSPISEHRSRNLENSSSNPDHAKKSKKFRMLHSGEEFGISIDAYKVTLLFKYCEEPFKYLVTLF